MEEKEIIEGCIKRNTACQKLLYDKYKNALFTLAIRLSGSYEEAQDIFQDGMIQIFKSLKSFNGQSALITWMKTIMSRTAYRSFRKVIPMQPLEDVDDSYFIDWGESISVELLDIALKMLPDGFRMVIILIELEGYKHREVAEMLTISEGTSKSQLFHGKKKLKEILLKLEEDERGK